MHDPTQLAQFKSSQGKLKMQLVRLETLREKTESELAQCSQVLNELDRYLAIAVNVTEALEILSDQLFRETLTTIENKLSIALQEILEQPIKLIAKPSWRNSAAAVDFHIERDGNAEDILRGQGGSVANIVSIGLRMFALASLDPEKHRAFLVLDEQDCWLKPELVPRLAKIIRDAGHALGFQVLVISHHDRAIFEPYADRIFQLHNEQNGVTLEILKTDAGTTDDE